MTEAIQIQPISSPVNGRIRPPGSKSITNRALILAALADGTTTLTGVLDSQDTRVMIESLRRLGFTVDQDLRQCTCRITGLGGRIPAQSADLWLENSGTSIRFLTSLCALGHGQYRLDGVKRMRERPIGDLVRTLSQLGTSVRFEIDSTDCPPIVVDGAKGRLNGGQATIAGDISSQFLSSLLMAAPAASNATSIVVSGELVSKPYVTMTLQMMSEFGIQVEHPDDLSSFQVLPGAYKPRIYEIEPDASAASYFFALAAITQGTVTVEGLTRTAMQGDVGFVDALQQMGCEVQYEDSSITVTGKPLHGIDVDMNAISDTAQTLAVVAVFADSPTTIRNVGHMRHKETDRIAAVVTELNRAGIAAHEHPNGLQIEPGPVHPADIHTYDDHRMAMSFSLLGLRAQGIRILDPGCTAKTYPGYFEDLGALCETSFQRGEA
ncbi:MAG: 3-phosphoshikimate 1-carboxyvinyltransferase [Planctomycetaceae bacterium]|nr:3-phosphoshikimate 1-carboxyvinyltransferase [Planctomycetaceae bacterium]